jgi:hypothetical protein
MSLLKKVKDWYKGRDGELTVKLIHWMSLWITSKLTCADTINKT